MREQRIARYGGIWCEDNPGDGPPVQTRRTAALRKDGRFQPMPIFGRRHPQQFEKAAKPDGDLPVERISFG